MVIELWKSIKKKEFSPIYLLFGTENFLISETEKLIQEHALGDERDFNLSIYDLEETPVEEAIEDAETFPFLGERKVIILHNPSFLTAEKTKEKTGHDLQRLEAYLKQPAPYTVLVFSAHYEKLDDRKKITKELKRTALTAEMKKLGDHELKSWVANRAESSGINISTDAVESLLALSGSNLSMLANELDKLALYMDSGQRIDVQTVELLVPKSLEHNIFNLTDKVINRNPGEALRIYYDLVKLNEEPVKILALLAGQFRLLYQIKELAHKGYGQQQMASFLKVHPYRVKMAAGLASRFSERELASIMKSLAEADYQMKTGGADKSLLVELFLMRLNNI